MRKYEKILDDLASKKWLPYVRYESDFLWEGKAGENGKELPFLRSLPDEFDYSVKIFVFTFATIIGGFLAYLEFQKTTEEAFYFHLLWILIMLLFLAYDILFGERDTSTQYRITNDYVLISRIEGQYVKRRKLYAVQIEQIDHIHLLGFKNGTSSILLYLKKDIEIFDGQNLGEYDVPTLHHLKDAKEVKEILEELIHLKM